MVGDRVPSRQNIMSVLAGALGLFLMLRGASPYLPASFAPATVILGVALLILTLANLRVVLCAADLAAVTFALAVVGVTLANGLRAGGPILATLAAVGIFVGTRSFGRQRPEWTRLVVLSVALLVLTLSLFTLWRPRYDWSGVPVYFTGGKNSVAVTMLWVLPVISLWWMPARFPGRVARIVASAAALAVLFLCGSSTAQVLAVLAVPLMVLPRRAFARWRVWLVGLLAFHMLVLTGWLMASFGWLQALVTVELGKDSTFTGRSYIWSRSWDAIAEQPFGYGRGNSYVATNVSSQLSETHNLFLEAGLAGGLLLMFVVAVVVTLVVREAALGREPRMVMWIVLAGTLGVVESITFLLDFWFLLAVSTVTVTARTEVTAGAQHLDAELQPFR